MTDIGRESDKRRLARLVALIDDENPIDGIHDDGVETLYELATSPDDGGTVGCPRYLGCTSEGTAESTYRSNPDFFAGTAEEVAGWLAGSCEEGWAPRWVIDLETGNAVTWKVRVEIDAEKEAPCSS